VGFENKRKGQREKEQEGVKTTRSGEKTLHTSKERGGMLGAKIRGKRN